MFLFRNFVKRVFKVKNINNIFLKEILSENYAGVCLIVFDFFEYKEQCTRVFSGNS